MSAPRRTVWKYVLHPVGPQPRSFRAPVVRQVLSAAPDPGEPGAVAVYVEVDPDRDTGDLVLALTGTGHSVPDGYRYVGTVVDQPFAWHVWHVEQS